MALSSLAQRPAGLRGLEDLLLLVSGTNKASLLHVVPAYLVHRFHGQQEMLFMPVKAHSDL